MFVRIFFFCGSTFHFAPAIWKCSRNVPEKKIAGILFFNSPMHLHLKMCFNMHEKGYIHAEGFLFANKLCRPLKMEAIDASELSWEREESLPYTNLFFTVTEWSIESECHTSECIFILSNPTKKGLSHTVQNMTDSTICGFLKMPPPHKK